MKKNTKQTKYNNPGRPRRQVTIPKAKVFSFSDIQDANGCDSNPKSKTYGKALTKDGCTTLCLRNFLKRDNARKGKSLIIKVKGVTAEPNSESGLGRRKDLYCLRVNKDSISTPTQKTRKVRTHASTSQTPTADALDTTKQELGILDPVPTPVIPEVTPATLTLPAVTFTPEAKPAPVTPVAPAPEVAPATPAPVATESANAETATPVAQPVAS